jgi:ribosomal protein S18 acetylase RimI-like enzyme
MEKTTPIFQLLSDTPPPAVAPKTELRPNELVEVYGWGDERAVIIICPNVPGSQSIIHIREPWLSVDEPTLAAALISAIQQRHHSPDAKLVIQVRAETSPTLFSALRLLPVLSQIMVKPINGTETEIPVGLRWRHMQAEEMELYLERVTYMLAETTEASKEVKEEWDAAMKTASETMKLVLPEGVATTGHTFAVVEDAEKGGKVAVLWVAMLDGEKSFCYNIEVEEGMRGRGLGKKSLVIWEVIAAGQGATSMGLNVYGTNIVALKLYQGAAFILELGKFILDTNSERACTL